MKMSGVLECAPCAGTMPAFEASVAGSEWGSMYSCVLMRGVDWERLRRRRAAASSAVFVSTATPDAYREKAQGAEVAAAADAISAAVDTVSQKRVPPRSR
jgi:hypothetical protein